MALFLHLFPSSAEATPPGPRSPAHLAPSCVKEDSVGAEAEVGGGHGEVGPQSHGASPPHGVQPQAAPIGTAAEQLLGGANGQAANQAALTLPSI